MATTSDNHDNGNRVESRTLRDALNAALPRGSRAHVRYLHTTSRSCEQLFSPLPGTESEPTRQVSHFLTVSTIDSIPASQHDVLVYAVEILVYTTRRLTTVFVSKADSTGFRSQHSPAPIRNLTTAFLRWLLERELKRRPQRPIVVSLFGRAQGAYLFPGSAENSKKHVLDDRQLIKWWVKVLDPILTAPSIRSEQPARPWHGFITVPGYQGVELRQFLPSARTHWTAGNPLADLANIRDLPEHAPTRCLLPRFPDDPKARFMQDLDDEVGLYEDAGASAVLSPTRRKDGRWKTIHSLDRFWEAMEFRQECSSGRVVGFLWLVLNADHHAHPSPPRQGSPSVATSRQQQTRDGPTKHSARARKKKPRRKGLIAVRPPRIKGNLSAAGGRARAFDGDGITLVQDGYDQAMQTLLHLDFATLESAAKSTSKWIKEISVIAKLPATLWTLDIHGTAEVAQPVAPRSSDQVNDLGSMIRKKKRGRDEAVAAARPPAEDHVQPSVDPARPVVNMLGAGLVRKKAKTAA